MNARSLNPLEKMSFIYGEATMDSDPIRLKKDPIIEAIFEVRFKGKIESVSDVLPGLIFSKVRKEYSKIETSPIKSLPAELLKADPNLKYKPYHRLIGENYIVQMGEHVFSISCPKPYRGWTDFQKTIEKFLIILKQTDLVKSVERFSLKYVNLLASNISKPHLDMLKADFHLGPYDLKQHPTQIRTELFDNGFANVVQIISQASVAFQDGKDVSGLLIDIDTISTHKFQDFWAEIPELLKACHKTEKKVFFNILTDETLKNFEPVWETT